MTAPIRVLGLSGSLRRQSLNTALLRAAAELAPAGVTVEIVDLAALPFYNQDIDGADAPAAAIDLRARLKAADAVLLASPEYNYSIAPVLKNALDWASRPYGQSVLDGKPAALLGVGGGMGTSRAQYHLRQVGVFLNMHIINKPEIFVVNAPGKFDDAGRLVDEPTRTLVAQQLTALRDWTRLLQAGRAATSAQAAE